jgi:CRISPR system Cascade subunit CasC
MSNKNFVNYHILISHSPSCLNRDDMNMQKTAVFGGVRRVRISSQSLKRAIRRSDYYQANFERSSRSRIFVNQILEEALAGESDANEKKNIEKTALYLSAVIEGKTKPEEIKSYKRADSGRVEHQVLPLHDAEIAQIRTLLDKATKQADEKKIDFIKAEMKSVQEAEKARVTLDVALSGRMAPSEILYDVDGALSVAHVISTHGVDGDIDWFTAVDDLVAEAGDVGAGHLNTQEFSSGVFYRYATLNLRQLQVNLGLIRDIKEAETEQSRAKALEIAKHVLRLLATVVPSGKQRSMAAHNPAEFALVSLADQPISLANAFETPIKNGHDEGFLPPSIAALASYWHTVNSKYSLNERAAAFSLREYQKPDLLYDCGTLPKLESWVQNDGQE